MTQTDRESAVVVGAGMAGLMAARLLADRGWRVTILEKGRGLGGRMANRRMGEARIDHGAQFFTARDPKFQARIESWRSAGIVRIWYERDSGSAESPARPHYCSLPAMTAIPKHLAEGLDTVLGQPVTGLGFDGDLWTVTGGESTFRARQLLLTAPLPQSLALVTNNAIPLPAADYDQLSAIGYDKCIAVLATLNGPSGLPAPGLIRPDNPEPLAVLADNQCKDVSPVPAVTLHSGPDFAETYFETSNEDKISALLEAAAPYLQSQVIEAQAHRWGFAKPRATYSQLYYQHPDLPLLLAGDAFGGGRVEGAARSGLAAAEKLQENSAGR